MNAHVKEQLAPGGVLRAGINMSNFLLVSSAAANGDPAGVSPDMAKAIAGDLGVELQLIPYKGPGDVADGAINNEWDIANIAAEAERAKTIAFSPAYCEIQATYLLPPGSRIQSLTDVDQPGVKISVKERAAYDLWLTENMTQASLVRTATMDDSFAVFKEQKLDVLAGLRPRLLDDAVKFPGSVVMEQSFTAVQQSIGCQPDKTEAANYLSQFVRQSISQGRVAELIDKHGVTGKLSVAPLPST